MDFEAGARMLHGKGAVRPERARDLFIPEQRHQFEIFATLVATALERVHYVDVARDAMLMAGIQSGEVGLELERRPVAEVVGSSLRSLGALLAKHKVSVAIPADLGQPPMDSSLMQRVFVSLAGNVAKHTPAGTHLAIAARELAGDIEVSFEDDGPGLPKGREEEVFDSFARGEKQATRRGAGLGLAISRAIVAAHGGSIRAQTPESGKGARIVIRLPLLR